MNRSIGSVPVTPPECGSTIERLHQVLDGELPSIALESDQHAVACPECRDRIVAARLMLGALALPCGSKAPTGLTETVVAAVREDRFARIRTRSFAAAMCVVGAMAASVLIAASIWNSKPEPVVPAGPLLPEARLIPSPEPQPVRIGDEFAKVGQALRDSSKPITDPAASAPQILSKLTASLTRPVQPDGEFDAARKSIADLPDAARIGLEPVTATTQKAFARLMRDVGAVQISAKPKS